MWRRVASQSPTTAPTSSDDDPAEYLNAWTALGNLLASGRSLSGRERNCCFLNTQTSGFADISAVAGFDFPDDARGLAVVDWDGDGDLDAWVTNRTGPRLRFMKNDYAAAHHFLNVSLHGVTCNRDAIGARIEVSMGRGQEYRLIRSLRAGEGYLAQSSKQLHFGLGNHTSPVEVVVQWPGGKRETFASVAVDQHILLVQGTGKAITKPRRDDIQLAASTTHVPISPAEKRIVVPARLPIPTLTYLDLDGKETSLAFDGRPLLINLWATWCTPCLQEITEWSQRQQQFKAQGVRVVLLSVDSATEAGKDVTPARIRDVLDRLDTSFDSGIATSDTLDRLDVTQQVLTKRIRSLPVPCSFLIDAKGRLAVLYKGRVSIERLLSDMRSLAAPEAGHRDLAVPFPGRWYTNPFPPDLIAIPDSFREREEPALALDYLNQHLGAFVSSTSEATSPNMSRDELAEMFVGLGLQLQQQGDRERVITALRSATEVQPTHFKARLALAMIHQQSGEVAEAVQQYREMLRLKPSDPVVANNLAWVLATTPDEKVRAPREAIQLAEEVCARSERKFAPALDTLAAAYAAAGDFKRAAATAAEAISLLQRQGSESATQPIRERLKLYRQGKPMIER